MEGWGLYAEYLIRPYLPLEGQLISLNDLLRRAARAFLALGLQAGKVAPEEAKPVLEQNIVKSPASAEPKVERYTYSVLARRTATTKDSSSWSRCHRHGGCPGNKSSTRSGSRTLSWPRACLHPTYCEKP